MRCQNLISIVIPVYNGVEYLHNTLLSAVRQTYNNIEIIIVDDGSEEDIESLVKSFDDNRIMYYRLSHKNADSARNFGINISKGMYIAMLDSDDIWESNHLCDCMELLLKEGADGLYGSLILYNKFTKENKIFYVRSPKEYENMIDYLLLTGYGAQTSTLFMKSETAKDILWDENMTNNDDYDFVVRYCKKYKMIPKTTPTVTYTLKNRTTCDFISCIYFIEKYREEIKSDIYFFYHKNMLQFAKRINAKDEILTHYKKEILRYKELISFKDYI
ncbi:MAG: glycosyltransferase family 2 protein, partial [Clostridia bacterium]|nr:glycosyltransferase family 2 protein [Clostridia bacterium]